MVPGVPRVSPAGQRTGGRDVGVKGGIEVEDVSVLLGQSAVPVVADAGGKSEVRLYLELVLQEEPKLIGPVVAVGVALQESGDVIVVVGGHESLHELAKIRAGNAARAGAAIPDVELGEAIAATEANAVFSAYPDRVPGGLQAVLEDAGIRSLVAGARTDIQRVADSRYLTVAQHMNDRNPGEISRPEGVDGCRWVAPPGMF